MRKLVILIAAAASLAVPIASAANADDYGYRRYHHERDGEYRRHGDRDYRRHDDNGAGIALGLGAAIAGAAIASGSRHHVRNCWYEKRVFYRHGHRFHRAVEVCR